MSKLACKLPQILLYTGFFKNKKGAGTSFQTTFFVEIFDEIVLFVMLRKLAKFHQQSEIMFTFQVIQ